MQPTLATVVGAWFQHVWKLEADLPCGDGDRTVWGAYDVVAAATIRSTLGARLIENAQLHDECVSAAVEEVDQIYRRFTEIDVSGILIRIAEVAPASSEWWWRPPRSGPARRELDGLAPGVEATD